jgi:hypothetical protein
LLRHRPREFFGSPNVSPYLEMESRQITSNITMRPLLGFKDDSLKMRRVKTKRKQTKEPGL